MKSLLMKRFILSLALFASFFAQSQVTPTPDKLWGKLFEDVQTKRAMGDNKTFVDMVPQYKPEVIVKKYMQLKNKDSANLRAFVLANFYLPMTPNAKVTEGLALNEHLQELWTTLT